MKTKNLHASLRPMASRWMVATLLMALTVGCGKADRGDGQGAVKVNVQTVAMAQQTSTREYAGVVEESFAAQLSFGASGRVEAILVNEGQHVGKGQLLARIDNTTALNSYRAAKATLTQAQDGYERAKKVHDEGGLPEVKWTEVQTQLDKAQSLADIAKKNLDDCELRAPAAGTISNRTIERGTSVTAFQPVMSLVGLEGLYVKTSLPEGDINSVGIGTEGVVVVDTLRLPAVVEERNPTADALTHSYVVRLRLKESPATLLPGMVGKVVFQSSSTAGNEVEIPARAVQIDNEGHRFVWVVEEGKAAMRRITIGDLSRQGVVVSHGLQPGDRVIVDGMLKVASGTPVVFDPERQQ